MSYEAYKAIKQQILEKRQELKEVIEKRNVLRKTQEILKADTFRHQQIVV